MAKGKKKRTATGVVLLQGTAAAVGVYLAGVLLLALLVVKGVVPERAAFPAVAVLCLLGALSGGGVAARGTPWGPLPAALLNTALFAAVLLVVGLACWPDGVGGRGVVLLLCALGGGLAAGVLGGRRGRRRKRK
ncbi:hypothetical protein [Dysosmobacter sp.]|uniref:hypothetical protein n=1 Tax=Dysosmobacter sp. TaxID=2591382 RepID=UPI002A921BA0|nr:hypothetical protein [Dysosmobacter sp.]MDY5613570.1 hypothetical protein [Dysosmobacter sp.]